MYLPIAQLAGLGALCLLGLVGCEHHPSTAFPLAATVAARAGGREKNDVATLDRGRRLYTTSCTECHVARPIARYSVPQWRHYIDIMAPRAGLQGGDRAALEAYVIAARESMPGNPPAGFASGRQGD